jgi:site-specific DNA-methyltransferase (adenine-specific)/adenine-specific DNA-methyltransferase
MKLSPNEIRDITNLLEAGKPLPEKYRFVLFGEKRKIELVWDGKSNAVTDVNLPFQVIEQVDEPRSENLIKSQLGLFDGNSGRQLKGWSNKLIWGDNKFVLSSLRSGALRDEIEKNGGIKLIYIDPPFDVGADFSIDIEIGDDIFNKSPSILEEIAYRDTWGNGQDSFMSMIYQRLILMRNLLAEDGSIFVHCDWRLNSNIRLIMDEIFGKENFQNEIIWYYRNKMGRNSKNFAKANDTILFYSKSSNNTFNEIKIPREKPVKQSVREWRDGKNMRARDEFGAVINEISTETTANNIWDIPYIASTSSERNSYPTQKPESLLERVINSCTNENDIICDFFVGSGTTAAVAEKLNRKWIVSDLGKYAIHTTKKRLISVQRKLKDEGKNWRAFEVINLGKYERGMLIAQHTGLDSDNYIDEIQRQKDKQFENLIIKAYSANTLENDSIFVGVKNNRLVSIGPSNLPVTRLFVEKVIKECKLLKSTKVDILAFEYEMGLFPNIQDDARKIGVDIAFKYIPRDIFDKRAVESGQVKFHDVAYIEVKVHKNENIIELELIDYSVGYQQDSLDSAEKNLGSLKSKIVIENGQVVKISKDKDGIFSRNLLTKNWKDWIDYWAIDWDFSNRKEIVNVKNSVTGEIESQWTGDYIFENEWQSFRTNKDRKLDLKSIKAEFPNGIRKVAVKVVDIFGNDTMKIVEIQVGK